MTKQPMLSFQQSFYIQSYGSWNTFYLVALEWLIKNLVFCFYFQNLVLIFILKMVFLQMLRIQTVDS